MRPQNEIDTEIAILDQQRKTVRGGTFSDNKKSIETQIEKDVSTEEFLANIRKIPKPTYNALLTRIRALNAKLVKFHEQTRDIPFPDKTDNDAFAKWEAQKTEQLKQEIDLLAESIELTKDMNQALADAANNKQETP